MDDSIMSFLSCPWSRVVHPGRVFLIILSKWSRMHKTSEEKSTKNWATKKERGLGWDGCYPLSPQSSPVFFIFAFPFAHTDQSRASNTRLLWVYSVAPFMRPPKNNGIWSHLQAFQSRKIQTGCSQRGPTPPFKLFMLTLKNCGWVELFFLL